MSHPRRVKLLAIILLVLLPLFAAVGGGTASAAVPTLQWSPPATTSMTQGLVTSPNGNVTIPCVPGTSGSDLRTYSSAGQLVQDVSRTSMIDGSVPDCISNPAVDKNGTVYGIPAGVGNSGSWVTGRNLLAYSGNTLQWEYPVYCSSSQTSQVAVGGDGNTYATTSESDGVHLIGLNPILATGQTVPTKVFDIKVANDCSIMLHPYTDGIMLHGQSSGNPSYYSYSGKFLGQAPIGDVWYEKVNDQGQLFVTSYVSGSFKSMSVSMYDPRTGIVAWTTSASTSGASVQGGSIYPLPNGGVVALIREQKMVQGMPAVPTEYVDSWVTLTPTGQVLTPPRQMPNMGTLGSGGPATTYGGTYASVDGGGQLALVRPMTVATTISYPATVPAISITLLDPASGTVSYAQVMSGDVSTSQPYGYNMVNPVVSANGTVFIEADCNWYCPGSDTSYKVYALNVPSASIDYPRGHVLTAYPRSPMPYLALGDSYSSGEGVSPFAAGTDVPGVNLCHRSTVAYPQLLSGTSSNIPSLGTNGFRACSGAVTSNIWDIGQANEGIQIDRYPDAATTLVTITIGGNDIGFANYATACVLGDCSVGSTAYNTATNLITNVLPGALKSTYDAILRAAPNANVYVVGYPQVVEDKGVNDPPISTCSYFWRPADGWANAQAARHLVAQLDLAISTAVTTVGNESADYQNRLHFVDTNASNSPFIGHYVCSSSSYFQNVNQALTNSAYVFHPNQAGQNALATIVGAAINAG